MEELGQCYKQLNSSVGEFGTDTLIASTNALESTSPSDEVYTATEQKLAQLDGQRDALAGQLKQSLDGAEFGGGPAATDPKGKLDACNALPEPAQALNG